MSLFHTTGGCAIGGKRVPKRVLFGHMDGNAAGFRGRAQKQWADYVREDLQFAWLSLN